MTQSTWQLNGQPLIDPASLLRTLSFQREGAAASGDFHNLANSFTQRTGRETSTGYLLATGTVIKNALANPPIELEIYSDLDTADPPVPLPDNSYKFSNLSISTCRAITPAVEIPNPETDPIETLTDDTVYLIRVSDQRSNAAWTTLNNEFYNWDNSEGDTFNPSQTYKTILDDIWAVGLNALLGPLTWLEDPQATKTKQYRITGQSAWTAFNDILEDAGCILAPNKDNTFWHAQPLITEITLSPADQTRFDDLKKTHLIDAEGDLIKADLPEKVHVYYHLLGQQYHLNSYNDPAFDTTPNATPNDKWNENPFGYIIFDTVNLIQPTPTTEIIPNTVLPLWAPVLVYRGPTNQLLNYASTQELQYELEEYATRYLTTQLKTAGNLSWTFSGVHAFELSNTFTSLSIFDFGGGIKTRLDQQQQFPKLPQAEYPGKPDATRRHNPNTRIAYIRARVSADQDPTQGGVAAPSTQQETAQPGESILCDILYYDTGEWRYAGKSITVLNFFSTPLPRGKFYHVHFNYQASDSEEQTGRWIFLSGGSSSQSLDQKPAVAIVDIPGRVGATPGQASVQPKTFNGTFLVDDGPLINILNWSRETFYPFEQPNSELWIWIAQSNDADKTWYIVTDEEDKVQENSVATIRTTIPARTEEHPGGNFDLPKAIIPGGPVLCDIYWKDNTTDNLIFRKTIDVYSWVGTPSPDPTVDDAAVNIGTQSVPDFVIFIFVNQDRDGRWWYIANDCSKQASAIETQPSGGTVSSDGAAVVYVTD